MERHNCPNCGAPIESTQCPYCGTVFYDFTTLDSDKPTYIRMNWHGNQIVFMAIMRSAEIEVRDDPIPYYVDNKNGNDTDTYRSHCQHRIYDP